MNKEPEDEIEANKISLITLCRPGENKKKQQHQHQKEEEESLSASVSTLAFQKAMKTNEKNAEVQKVLEVMRNAIDAEVKELTPF